MSNTDTLAHVALRPWPAPNDEAYSKEDLAKLTHQLVEERGPLRGITEQALQDEIETGETVPEDVMEGVDGDAKKEGPTTEEKMKEITRVRHEVFSKIQWASFAVGNAMNLVSMLLSQDTARDVEAGFTPMFKSLKMPKGSLGGDVSGELEDVQWKEYNDKRRALVMKGSRMQAFDWATDSLLQAATELETGIRKETKYWEEILSISEKGWPIERTRKNMRHTSFAVRYGLPEASNHFQARGLAPLRMSKDGSIVLDSNLSLQPKTLRVRISDNGRIVGSARLPTHRGPDGLAIEQSIQLAQDSLFEEELFHEMSMESRNLLALGVELRNSVIHVPTPISGGSREILIDCAAREMEEAIDGDHSHNRLARCIADCLRVLLAHEHRMRLHRRSHIPPPLTQARKQDTGLRLLRTMIGVFEHLSATEELYSYLHAVTRTCKSAGIDVALRTTRETSWATMSEQIKETHTDNLPEIDRLLKSFTRPYDGNATLTLPPVNGAQAEEIIIGTRTFVGHSTSGAEHRVTLPPSIIQILDIEPDQPRHFRFSTTSEARSYIDWLLCLHIAHSHIAQEYAGRIFGTTSEPCISILSKGTRKSFTKEDSVLLEMKNAVLTVSAIANSLLGTGATVESFSWDGSANKPAVLDQVRSWIK